MAQFDGTDESDFIFGTEEDDQIIGLDGDDFLSGGGGNDFIDGGGGNDQLSGGDANDTLLGDTGDDLLAGNAGADRLTGGAGNDRFSWRISPSFFASTDSISLAQDTVTDFQGAGVPGGDTLVLTESSSRRMVFEGARAAMPAVGASVGFGGNGFTEVFYAFQGGDTILFADSDDDGIFDADDFAVRLTGHHNLVAGDFGTTPFVIRGTNGDDTIVGTDDGDTIFGLGGNDTISGGGGNDVVEGGDGNDRLSGDAGNDRLAGGRGNDILMGGDGRDNITGDEGNDVINGGAGNDTGLSGGDGNDVVLGGDGNDNVDGDDGNDMLFGGAGGDDIVAGDGNDALFGEAGDDFLQGGPGSDAMFGGDGDDEIVGYEQADLNHGGAGDDTFGFFLGTFSPSSIFAEHDVVLDFEGAGVAGGDLIDLNDEQVVFGGEVNINPRAGAPLPGAGNGVMDLVYTQRKGDTWLIADENDNGRLDNSDFAVQFEGLHDFTRADFDDTTFVTVGTNGDDEIIGTEDSDIIFAAGGNDEVFGNGGDDELHGGSGDDFLDSGTGFDDLYGEDGNDTLIIQEFGGFFAAGASGGAGDDHLFGSDVSFSFVNLRGDEGNDHLHAGAGGTVMYGGTGTDLIYGGVGDDFMNGGPDGFTFDGEQDLFVFGTSWGSDQIGDFEDGIDLMDLSGSGLQFSDLTIEDAFGGGGFATRISAAGVGEIVLFVDPANITAEDFVFA